jgi:hypothetical protein
VTAILSDSVRQGTCETVETDCVTNAQFLHVVFEARQRDALPIVVSFPGDPLNARANVWAGNPWGGEDILLTSLPADVNNYFSLATFNSDDAGRYRRRKAHFAALHAVMLDDIGTKVNADRLTLPVSWLLETSAGNYQAGYLLVEPLADGRIADRLMNAIVAASLCDPGANGPQARLARLPRAVNGKHEPPFPCQLAEWSPHHRYSVDELIDGLQLDMSRTVRPARPGGTVVSPPDDGEPVTIPRPTENLVLAALRAKQLYRLPLGDGKHDITCPWAEEHTGGVIGGTAYFEPDDSWPIGGFKCLHGHCADRHIRELLRYLDVELNAARMKPTIRVVPGEIHRVVDVAELELSRSEKHYQRGCLIVIVVTDPGTRETGIQEISQPALVRALAGAATWERYDARSRGWVRTDPPARHTSVLFDSSTYRHLPVLEGLARQPYLRPDGSLMGQAGYDPPTKMFGVFDAAECSVHWKPTRIDAEAALVLLQGLIAEFAFASITDSSAALSAFLTAAVRSSLAHAPMFHVRSHAVGSGKSYLCELITAFATPRRGTPMSFPGDDEECRKLLLAELLRSPAVLEFDNLTGDLVPHKSLCTALTSEHMAGRILGVSKTATVNTRALFLSSGNNVGPVKDMTRRCITIGLDPVCEIPAARTFARPDLVREVLEERGQYVAAALTIVRAWIEAGRPKSAGRALAGFSDWSDYCRQPLLWLGLPDPTASVFEAMAEDPDRDTLARLLVAWESRFGKAPTMVRDAVKQSSFYSSDDDLSEVLRDIADERGEINRRKLGWWIRRHEGRVVDGRRFARAPGNRSAERWRVEPVLPVSTVVDQAGTKSVTKEKASPNVIGGSEGTFE